MTPTAAGSTLHRAIAHHQAGRLAEAESLYRETLTQDPQCADAIHYLGVIAHQVRKFALAVELIGRAAQIAPHDATIHGNLGEALRQLGRLDEAIDCFQRALLLRPNYPDAWSNLGNAFGGQARHADAITCYRRALELRPEFASAHSNLATVLKAQGKLDEAVASFRRALQLQPDRAELYENLGGALARQGKLDEALTHLRRAEALAPDAAEIQADLGALLKDRGELCAALKCCRRAVELAPANPRYHSNLILALQYAEGLPSPPITAEQHAWYERHARPLAPHPRSWPNDRSPNRRLRIGYVSADFYTHVVGLNLLPLFRCHAREQFELFCYSSAPEPDALTQRFREYSHHWRDVTRLTDEQLARQVRDDGIDILVDLGLHTANTRLLAFAFKPAPVQLSFAGYPGGTGLDMIDYHLTDPYLEPAELDVAQSHDKPHRLSTTFWCYEPETNSPEPGPPPMASIGAVTFGCLNNFCKVNDSVLDLWSRVLDAVDGSRLLLLCGEGHTRQRVVERVTQGGVAADRVAFVGRQSHRDYLALYRQIDVGLDTFPYNGHTTSLDSFWMGVPVISLVGRTTVGRAGLSQLSNLGLPDLVARRPEEFVAIAAALARDEPRLTHLRATLRARMQASPLMDAGGFAQSIEQAYRAIWRDWCARSD